MIMAIDSEDFSYVPDIDLTSCPFYDRCRLSKLEFLCKIPDCKKTCPEFLSRYEAMTTANNNSPKI